jgi:hypothetical protein
MFQKLNRSAYRGDFCFHKSLLYCGSDELKIEFGRLTLIKKHKYKRVIFGELIAKPAIWSVFLYIKTTTII